MDLSNFSLLKEDQDSYHIKHPGGKTLKVDKAALSSKAHEAIKKFASGGMAHYDEGTPDAPISADDTAQSFKPLIDVSNPAEDQVLHDAYNPSQPDESAPDPINITAPENLTHQSDNSSPQATGQASPAGQSFPTQQGSGFSMEQAGNQALASAIGKEGQQEAQAIDANAQSMGQLPSAADIVNANKPKDQELQQAFQDGRIDPQRFLNNMGTGSKIMAGIGMVLSGFGAGASGQPNMARQIIENAIDRDIAAQQNDQSKKMSQWKMNREALGTDLQANLATKQQMYTALQYQLQKTAAQSKGPEEQARAQVANGEIQRQLDQLHFQQAMLNPTQETAGGAAPGSEQAQNNHLHTLQQAVQLGIVKPEVYKDVQERTLPGIGVAIRTPTSDQVTDLTNYDTINKALNKAVAFQQSGHGGGIGAWSPANRQEAGVIQQGIANSMNQLLDSKRPASGELYKRYQQVVGNPGSFDIFGKNAAGLKQLASDISSRRDSSLHILGVKPYAKAPDDQAAIAWANQNRNDPRAVKILQDNGTN